MSRFSAQETDGMVPDGSSAATVEHGASPRPGKCFQASTRGGKNQCALSPEIFHQNKWGQRIAALAPLWSTTQGRMIRPACSVFQTVTHELLALVALERLVASFLVALGHFVLLSGLAAGGFRFFAAQATAHELLALVALEAPCRQLPGCIASSCSAAASCRWPLRLLFRSSSLS